MGGVSGPISSGQKGLTESDHLAKNPEAVCPTVGPEFTPSLAIFDCLLFGT